MFEIMEKELTEKCGPNFEMFLSDAPFILCYALASEMIRFYAMDRYKTLHRLHDDALNLSKASGRCQLIDYALRIGTLLLELADIFAFAHESLRLQDSKPISEPQKERVCVYKSVHVTYNEYKEMNASKGVLKVIAFSKSRSSMQDFSNITTIMALYQLMRDNPDHMKHSVRCLKYIKSKTFFAVALEPLCMSFPDGYSIENDETLLNLLLDVAKGLDELHTIHERSEQSKINLENHIKQLQEQIESSSTQEEKAYLTEQIKDLNVVKQELDKKTAFTHGDIR